VKPGGPSLGTDPAALKAARGSVRMVESIPEQLQIRQTGKNPSHYEIMPRRNDMTKPEFLELLDRVKYGPSR
jgi:hypothetical protein